MSGTAGKAVGAAGKAALEHPGKVMAGVAATGAVGLKGLQMMGRPKEQQQ